RARFPHPGAPSGAAASTRCKHRTRYDFPEKAACRAERPILHTFVATVAARPLACSCPSGNIEPGSGAGMLARMVPFRRKTSFCRAAAILVADLRGQSMRAWVPGSLTRGLVVAAAAVLLASGTWQAAHAQTLDKVTVRFTWKLKGEY